MGEEIDIQTLFNDYWNSDKHEFMITRMSWLPVVYAYLTEM